MPRLLRITFVTTLCLAFVPAALAQSEPGSCVLGTAQSELDAGDVFARVFNTGSLFYGNATVNGDGYLVPQASGNSPIFAAGLWVGGLVGGELRAAGSTYDRFEFWPGPLEEGATLPDPEDCSPYDRIWNVRRADVLAYEQTGEATADLAEWPVHLGAPVLDGDGIEGNYDLEAGDRPHVHGDQTAFWVMNDVGNEHRKTLTPPLGIEVRVTAFASADAALAQHTFYRYEVVNRSDQAIEEVYVAFFADTDVGNMSDDYVGSDSTRGMAFAYNASETDAVYGFPPPAIGYDFLSGGASSSIYLSPGGQATPPPLLYAETMYRYMRGLWWNGTPLTEGGDGYESDGPVTTWVYPGDPESGEGWKEVSAGMPPGDRRHLLSVGPFTLEPGEARTFDLAILFATGTDHLNSVTALKAVSDAVQDRYAAGGLFPEPVSVASASLPDAVSAFQLGAPYPNPSRSAVTVPFEVERTQPVRLAVYDVLGREVAVLADGAVPAGQHEATFGGRGLAGGVYVVVLEAQGVRESRRLSIVR